MKVLISPGVHFFSSVVMAVLVFYYCKTFNLLTFWLDWLILFIFLIGFSCESVIYVSDFDIYGFQVQVVRVYMVESLQVLMVKEFS